MLDLSSLNPRQKEAVETLEGPLLVLAGAGTGKTRVITFRIANLISRGISPAAILAVTFTNKAAREMETRARKLVLGLGSKAWNGRDRPVISTFHALGLRILRQHFSELGYAPNFVIYGESEQLSLVRKILSRISQAGPPPDPALVLAWLSRVRNDPNPRGAGDRSEAEALARHVQNRYEEALRASNAVDFDDLIGLPVKLLTSRPAVLAQCRDRFHYLMVDEYQDTNAAQFRLLRLLTGPEQNLCVVGDDDQSIYGWRGAETANLINLERHFPKLRVIKLEQNYRSTTTILDAANALIKNNPRRHAKKLWSQEGTGDRIVLHAFSTDEEEAERLVEQIQFVRLQEKRAWSDHAVLFRTNQQSRAWETAFRKAAVPYRLVGGQSFFDRREIRDFVAYLKLFLNPADEVSLLRVANVPARGLSEPTQEKLLGLSHQRRQSLFEVMGSAAALESFAARTRESIALFFGLIKKYSGQLRADPPVRLSEWARGWLRETGYLEHLRKAAAPSGESEERVQNIEQFISTMEEGPQAGGSDQRLQAFLEQLALEKEREEEEGDGDGVVLITIHSCKGLEFRHVYIVGLEDGILPHARSKAEGTVDEERRLFYVALTRARRTLTLSYCLGRKRYGEIAPGHPSPFLRELPPDLLESGEARGNKAVSLESAKNLFNGLRASVAGP